MLQFKEGSPPVPKNGGNQHTNPDSGTSRRATEIQEILMFMDVNTYVELVIDNPNAWYVSFDNARKKLGQEAKTFTRRKGDANGDKTNPKIYTVWRIK